MSQLSRRALARYAADQLLAGQKPRVLAKQLCAVLVESGRSDETDFLLNDVAWELEHGGALAVAKVTSAHALSQKLASALKNQVKKATDVKLVAIENKLDKDMLGGLRVETATRVWDDSTAQKIRRLREAF